MECKNCGTTLKENQKFCDNCGAPVIRNRLTPKVLAQQVNEQFLSIDNKFLKTLIALIIKPEDVIDGYINGLRRRYIGVIAFYAVSLTVLGFQMFLLKNFFPDFIEAQENLFVSGFNFGSQGAGDATPPPDFLNFFNDYQGVFFSILMPFLAIGTWVVYLDKKKHNYTEHLVINLYLTAQTIYFSFIIYLLLAAFNVQNYLIASMLVTPPLILYGAYVFNRIYKSTYIKSLIRYVAAYTIYMIVFSAIMVAIIATIFAYLLITGKFSP